MEYTQVLNPTWANAEHTAINCDVDFDDLQEELVPFTATSLGDYEHSHKIFAECVEGLYGSIAEYVAPPVLESVTPVVTTKEDLLIKLQELQQQIVALEAS